MDEQEAWENDRVKLTVPGPDGRPMRIEETCAACPTQYDVFLADGRYVYFRYRHQHWSLELFESQAAMQTTWTPLATLTGTYGDHPLDGSMSPSEVMGLFEVYLPQLFQPGATDVASYRIGAYAYDQGDRG